jgi:hypothetical protein
MESHPLLGRRTLSFAMLALALPNVGAQVTSAEQNKKFVISPTGIRTLSDLIRAMKATAGPLLPPSLPLKEYYTAISKAFVENAHAAVAAGIKGIPPEILERIPRTRVALPILVAIVLAGVTFLVPLGTLVSVVVGSLTVLMVSIAVAIESLGDRRRLKT